MCDEAGMDHTIQNYASKYPRTTTTHPVGVEPPVEVKKSEPTKQFSADWEAGFRPPGWGVSKANTRHIITVCQKDKNEAVSAVKTSTSPTGETQTQKGTVLCSDILAAVMGPANVGLPPTQTEPEPDPEP